MDYESTVEIESKQVDGVRFRIRRMSFGRRIELTKTIQGVLGKLEFIEAGEKSAHEEAEAALLGAQVDREYLRWGLIAVEGLTIDGEAATVETLAESGPEELTAEVIEAIRREARLGEAEGKNFESHSTLSPEAQPGGVATSVGV